MEPLDKAFMGLPKTLYCKEIEKRLHSNAGRYFTIYQSANCSENTIKLQQARQWLMAARQQIFSLVT
jgi:hypothetical protein